jgi:AraC-like DNA-binding protein
LLVGLTLLPTLPLELTFPRHPRLLEKCRAFLLDPRPRDTIESWCEELGMSRRTFTRLFRKETGISFSAWRQQACLFASLPRLAANEPITQIAFDLGYESPAAFARAWLEATEYVKSNPAVFDACGKKCGLEPVATALLREPRLGDLDTVPTAALSPRFNPRE